MPTFLSILGVAVLIAAYIAPLIHRKRRQDPPPSEPATQPASPINGDSRLPSGAFFG